MPLTFHPLKFLAVLAVFASVTGAQTAAVDDSTSTEEEISIGVLYRENTTEGDRLRSGVEKILTEHRSVAGKSYRAVLFPYPTEERGYRELKRIRDDSSIALVIGPTDSGVFRSALREQESFAKAGLPIVSPIVAAKFDTHSDWLFQTNADVRARTETMLNLLRQRGARSVGVLYEGTEFGLSSEEAFRDFTGELAWYQAARYSDEADLSRAIDILLEQRPAAIGILSSRTTIARVKGMIEAKKSGLNPYRPYIFSLIDVRSEKLAGLDFVSVGSLEEDETTVLTEMTMRQVLAVLDSVTGTPETSDDWAEDVKDGLAGVLERSPQGVIGERLLLTWEPGAAGAAGMVVDLAASEDRSFFGRLLQGPTILLLRFGFLPVANLLLVVGLVVALTRKDLLRWNDVAGRDRRTQMAMAKVVALNVLVALCVYLFMVSGDFIAWSSMTGAIVVGVGYPAMLKTTLGQTKTGQSIGLADFYDDFLRRLNDEIMLAKYHSRKQVVDYIAMTSSLVRMKDTLWKLYACNSPKRRHELIQAMEADLEGAKGSLEVRTVYARRIYQTHLWHELVSAQFVPPIPQDELIGPEEILQAAVEFCDESELVSVQDLRSRFEDHIKAKADADLDRANAAREEVEEWIAHTVTEAGTMRCYLRWEFMQVRFRVPKIIGLGYLPDDAADWDKEEWNRFSSRATDAKQQKWVVPGGGTHGTALGSQPPAIQNDKHGVLTPEGPPTTAEVEAR